MIDNEIRIGDEVRHKMGDLYIVTQFDNVWLYTINLDGYVYEGEKSEFAKTGRHFEQIEKALKQIRENNKEFEVWLEGYSATGQEGKHQYIGKEKAKDFKEACYKAIKKWCNNDKDFEEYYDSEKCTFWGCRCFDNEADSMYFD